MKKQILFLSLVSLTLTLALHGMRTPHKYAGVDLNKFLENFLTSKKQTKNKNKKYDWIIEESGKILDAVNKKTTYSNLTTTDDDTREKIKKLSNRKDLPPEAHKNLKKAHKKLVDMKIEQMVKDEAYSESICGFTHFPFCCLPEAFFKFCAHFELKVDDGAYYLFEDSWLCCPLRSLLGCMETTSENLKKCFTGRSNKVQNIPRIQEPQQQTRKNGFLENNPQIALLKK